ncbi:MAG: TonB-dependent receptor, partial [Saprospiraceae bacterium]
MMKNNVSIFLTLILSLFITGFAHAQTTISGTVMDDSGEALIGASVLVDGTTSGTVTDIDGKFSLTTQENPPFTITVSYTGFSERQMVIDGNTTNLSINLLEGVLIGEDIVISASRRREKVQEAPASISVISARKLETSANTTDPVRNLTNTAGVQIQQQSANRINISMRGGAGLFGTSVFPIMDYRSLVGPGIGTFQSDQAGISNIDLQRIEVVRGPGSALYGPGVTQGVVHFITKNPIDFPGTAVEVFGGELNTFGGSLRHAGRSENMKFGYKINFQHRRGGEFTLDPNDPDDAVQIAKFTTNGIFQPGVANGIVDVTIPPTQVLTQDELDEDGDGNPATDSWDNTSINATLEFRPADDLSVFLSGGFNNAKSIFYNEQGEGLAQANEYWAQARMQKGGLFAQFFVVNNDGGAMDNPTFLYQTGNRSSIARTQVEGQLQYNFDTPGFLDANWTAGADYRFASQDTENLVYGRNEDDDDYSVIGGYVQGKFAVADKLDLVAAMRYDQFNFIDDGAFAPRAALVYKLNPKHTLRGSFNRANSSVSNLQLNIDFPLSTIIPGAFDVWLYGNKTTQTFNNGTVDWFSPTIPSVPVGTPGLPLAVPFSLVNDATVDALVAGLSAAPM